MQRPYNRNYINLGKNKKTGRPKTEKSRQNTIKFFN